MLLKTACKADLHIDGNFEIIDLFRTGGGVKGGRGRPVVCVVLVTEDVRGNQ